MKSNEGSPREQRSQTERFAGGPNRRDLLKASVATGAAGLLAGCTGSLPVGGGSADQGEGGHHTECPTVVGWEDGFLWVHKTPPGPWGGYTLSTDESYVSGENIGPEFQGRTNIGMARVELDEPGEYEFQYLAQPGDLTWVEKPKSLMSVVFPHGPWEENELVRNEEIVGFAAYEYEADEPLTMPFTVDEPGTYDIAYGPANGLFVFEEWLPDITERDKHLNLGLSIEGGSSGDAASFVYPELPVHAWVWSGEESTVVSRAPNSVDLDCTLDESMQR